MGEIESTAEADEQRPSKSVRRAMYRFAVQLARQRLEEGERVGKVVDDFLDDLKELL